MSRILLTAYQRKKVLAFDELLIALHIEFDFSETSKWRTMRHNAAVGGKEDSKHLVGLACDCMLDDPHQSVGFIARCADLGLAAFPETDHIHVQVPKGQ
jgi:hypothetical protein